MAKKGALILLSNTPWHFAWQSANSIAAGFARRGYQVLYVEPIPKRWPRPTEIKRVIGRLSGHLRLAGFAEQEAPLGVQLISNIALPDIGQLAQALNQHLFIPRLASRLKKQLTNSPQILLHILPIKAAIALQKSLAPDVSIYRCVTNWPKHPYSSGKLAEEELLRHVDLAWADCDYNLQRIKTVHEQARLMPHAVELSLFSAVSYTTSGQADPLCVYFGAIGLSLDFELLRQISHRYKLRLIGPARQPLDGLSEETEIIGPVPHEQVPALIRDADVLLLPYNTRPHTKGLLPAKLFECLITGKPIVATNLTTIEPYRNLVYLCEGYASVFAAIESSQMEDKSLAAQRINCARENSWERRLDQMEQQIQTLLASPSKTSSRK